jgi:hypothetical protein
MNPPQERLSDRAHRPEKEISDLHLNGFSPIGSQGWEFIRDLIPDGSVTCKSLVDLAKVFSAISRIPFPRDFARRRSLVIKWFNDHLEELRPIHAILTIISEPLPGNDLDEDESRALNETPARRRADSRFMRSARMII